MPESQLEKNAIKVSQILTLFSHFCCRTV